MNRAKLTNEEFGKCVYDNSIKKGNCYPVYLK